MGASTVFDTQEKIDKLIEYRKAGYTFNQIGYVFGCDHTAVIYHWNKHINPDKIKKIRSKPKVHVQREGFCPKCKMKLSSEYHTKNPC